MGGFTCSLPNRELFKWFGVLSSLVLFTKAIVNLKCLLFCLGMPGLFGRNFLIYADSLQDNFDKKIFCITTNLVLVLLKTLFVVLKLVFVVPVQWLFAKLVSFHDLFLRWSSFERRKQTHAELG